MHRERETSINSAQESYKVLEGQKQPRNLVHDGNDGRLFCLYLFVIFLTMTQHVKIGCEGACYLSCMFFEGNSARAPICGDREVDR